MKPPKIKAVKDGKVFTFSQRAWKIGNHEKHGFKLIGEVEEAEKIPAEKIETIEIKTVEIPDEETEVVVKEVVQEEVKEDYPSDDEIRKYLNGLADEGKIKRPHHALGTKKLRRLYDENKK